MKARTKNVFFFGVQFTKLYSLTRMKWALKVNQGEELSWLYECWMFFLFSLSFSVRIHFTSANANASIVGIAQLSDYGYFHYRFAITLMKRYSHVYFVLWAVSFDCFCPMVHSYIRKMIVVPRVFTDRLESWLLYAQFADCVGVVFVVDVVPVLTCLIDIPHDNFHSQFGQAEWQ